MIGDNHEDLTNGAKAKILDSIEFRAAQTEQLFKQAPSALYGALTATVMLPVVLWNLVPRSGLVVWCVVLSAFYIARQAMVRRIHRVTPTTEDTIRWGRWFIISTAVSGALWGLATVLFFPHESALHQAIIVILTGGLCSGTVVAYCPRRPAYISYILLGGPPLMARFFYEGTHLHVMVGGIMLVFLIFVIVTGNRMHDTINDYLVVKFEKDNLIDSLTERSDLLRDEIAERLLAEEAVREREEQFRAIYENAPIMINGFSADGDLIFWNKEISRRLGWTEEEAKSEDILALCYPDPEACRKVKEDIKLADGRFRERSPFTRNGSQLTQLWANFRLRDQSTICVGLDITERKKAEQELAEALTISKMLRLEAEQANRAKSEFLTSTSHELRTPLNSIIGFSEILKDQVAGKLSKQQSRYVGHILDSGRHLLKLINDILDLAKVESGKMELEVSTVHLRKLLEISMLMIKEKAIKHRLKTRLRLGNGLDYMQIEADEVKLKQIMFNLLSNAAKFTPDGGEITVVGEKHGEEIRVSVSDSGIGLKPEDQERIFAVFEQVDSSYSRKEQGTGLGLALTKQLVELHGGVIYAESEGLGKGSTFTFILPVTESAEEAAKTIDRRHPDAAAERNASACAHSSVNGSSPVILIIEDNEVNMSLATTCLEEAGYRVLKANTARDGLRIARAEVPDLILMDVGLPGMDGLTATGIIRDDPQIRHIPIVALTAHAMSGDKEKALAAGCTGYIAKPIDTRAFSGTVINFMDAAKKA